MSFLGIKQRAQSLKNMYTSTPSTTQANSRNVDQLSNPAANAYQNRPKNNPKTFADNSGQSRSIVIEKEHKQTKTMSDLQNNLTINKDIIQSLIEA